MNPSLTQSNSTGAVRRYFGTSLVERLEQRGLLHVVDDVARRHGIERGDILGQSRLRPIVKARKETYVVMRERGLSYPEIGWLLGRDHSTVLDGVRSWRT